MSFRPYLSKLDAVLKDYHSIIDAERPHFEGINSYAPTTLENGELFQSQLFPVSQTELETRLVLLRPEVEPGLSLTLRFFSHKDGERIERGSVAVAACASVVENRVRMDWDIVAKRAPPAKLPRGAERLTGRLRAQMRSQELLNYEAKRRQLVSIIYHYALRGSSSLD
ncbi:hypothetical protein M0Q28_05225 [Patescibacteria group bacterium]|jgi:hypothetical protein|nr:hypothetical protein [Patescibacteria group bacterium]